MERSCARMASSPARKHFIQMESGYLWTVWKNTLKSMIIA
jgi:hypothetical protein